MKYFWLTRPALVAAFLMASLGVSFATPVQTVLQNTAVLGMSQSQIESTQPDALSVHSPRRLSSGALGMLQLPDVLCEGAHFEQTLFFKNQQLEQVDMVWLNHGSHGTKTIDTNTATETAFTQLLDVIRNSLGTELASAGSTRTTVMETASWVSGNADVMLYRSGKTENPTVRLVIKQRQLMDGSEL